MQVALSGVRAVSAVRDCSIGVQTTGSLMSSVPKAVATTGVVMYQPLSPSVPPVTTIEAIGGVVSSFTSTESLEEFPALSVQVPATGGSPLSRFVVNT